MRSVRAGWLGVLAALGRGAGGVLRWVWWLGFRWWRLWWFVGLWRSQWTW